MIKIEKHPIVFHTFVPLNQMNPKTVKAPSQSRLLGISIGFGLSVLFLLSSFGITSAGEVQDLPAKHVGYPDLGVSHSHLSDHHGSSIQPVSSDIVVEEENNDDRDDWNAVSTEISPEHIHLITDSGLEAKYPSKVPVSVPLYILFQSWKSFIS